MPDLFALASSLPVWLLLPLAVGVSALFASVRWF